MRAPTLIVPIVKPTFMKPSVARGVEVEVQVEVDVQVGVQVEAEVGAQ